MLLGANETMMNGFFVWILPRVVKNLGQFPIDVALLSMTVPAAQAAYCRVRSQYGQAK